MEAQIEQIITRINTGFINIKANINMELATIKDRLNTLEIVLQIYKEDSIEEPDRTPALFANIILKIMNTAIQNGSNNRFKLKEIGYFDGINFKIFINCLKNVAGVKKLKIIQINII